MVTRADATGPRPVMTVEALAPLSRSNDPRQESLARLLRIAVGEQLPGKVLSAAGDGTFLVKVGDAAARMALPAGYRTGDLLSLTLIGKEPRPTFLLERGADIAAPRLSDTSLLVSRLLQLVNGAGASPPSLAGKSPLLESPVAQSAGSLPAAVIDTPKLATALRDAVGSSGLFYESHLQQWASGKLPMAEVMREPQAQIGRFFQPGSESSGATDPRHAQMTTLVGTQLDALEQQRLIWRGEAWPGLPMEWRVELDTSSSANRESDPADRVWQSEVHFDMPTLGPVTARIRLAGGRLQMQIDTATPDAAAALRQNGPVLADRLEAAGSTLESFAVNHAG